MTTLTTAEDRITRFLAGARGKETMNTDDITDKFLQLRLDEVVAKTQKSRKVYGETVVASLIYEDGTSHVFVPHQLHPAIKAHLRAVGDQDIKNHKMVERMRKKLAERGK
jgi:hypothetical protein